MKCLQQIEMVKILETKTEGISPIKQNVLIIGDKNVEKHLQKSCIFKILEMTA